MFRLIFWVGVVLIGAVSDGAHQSFERRWGQDYVKAHNRLWAVLKVLFALFVIAVILALCMGGGGGGGNCGGLTSRYCAN